LAYRMQILICNSFVIHIPVFHTLYHCIMQYPFTCTWIHDRVAFVIFVMSMLLISLVVCVIAWFVFVLYHVLDIAWDWIVHSWWSLWFYLPFYFTNDEQNIPNGFFFLFTPWWIKKSFTFYIQLILKYICFKNFK